LSWNSTLPIGRTDKSQRRRDVDIEKGEAVEKDLDEFITRRASQEKATKREAAYQETVRKYHSKRREANRQRWIEYYLRMQESHRQLSNEYAEKAAVLMGQKEGAA
jgi:hypothetical protein